MRYYGSDQSDQMFVEMKHYYSKIKKIRDPKIYFKFCQM